MTPNKNYCPLTATPFKKNTAYKEVPPITQLEPYIRCFWGTENPYLQEEKDIRAEIVIPDTCVDIIYYIDYTENKVIGGFCGINDRSFYAAGAKWPGHLTATFAIRFFAWSAYAFAEDSLKDTVNGYYEVASRFEWLDKMIRPKLLELVTLTEKISYVEQLLLRKTAKVRENRIVNDVINNMLINRGVLEISDLARESFVSSRQLERLFHEYVGITPKKLSNLIRYQFLWRDILYRPDFNILNAVHQYGYTDQSHLLREFKRYHSMDIQSAKAAAFKNVENIQDVC